MPNIQQLMNNVKLGVEDEYGLDKGEVLLNRIRRRVLKHDRNFICIILGDTGSGKSWASLRLAERLDPNFNIDNVVFSSKDFLKRMARAKKGDAIVYEEVGVNMASRQWWKNFGSLAVMQTMRFRNTILIMNAPVLKFIDSSSTDLIHATFKMTRIKQTEGCSYMRPLLIETDGQIEFTKKAYPLINNVLISEIRVPKPSVKIRHEYKQKSEEFKNKLNAKYLMEETIKEKEEVEQYYDKLPGTS